MNDFNDLWKGPCHCERCGRYFIGLSSTKGLRSKPEHNLWCLQCDGLFLVPMSDEEIAGMSSEETKAMEDAHAKRVEKWKEKSRSRNHV